MRPYRKCLKTTTFKILFGKRLETAWPAVDPRIRTAEMREHFKKIYPRCSSRDIDNLVSAIISSKYWKVHPERDDALYVVALTRAKVPFEDGFKAETTAPKTVIVSPKAARFCRRGRVLIAKNGDYNFTSDTVVEWPAFLKLIRQDPNSVYSLLIENPYPPSFLNTRILKRIQTAPKQ